MNKSTEKPVLCPSGRCNEGSFLLGIVQENGKISFVDQKLIVNKEFVQIARKGRTPESRFRFSEKCQMSSCEQWKGDRCRVIDEVLDILTPKDVPANLPNCLIRSQCRWFRQSGAIACAVCPEVITET